VPNDMEPEGEQPSTPSTPGSGPSILSSNKSCPLSKLPLSCRFRRRIRLFNYLTGQLHANDRSRVPILLSD